MTDTGRASVCREVPVTRVAASVSQSVFLPAGDSEGIERLVRHMTRCPFSLSPLIKVTEAGHVVYKAEKHLATHSLTLIKRAPYSTNICPALR